MSKQWLLGIDEVGRGPLAGPVAVGLVLVPNDLNWHSIPGVTDSKQLSALRRESIVVQAKRLSREGVLHYSVAMTSARVIDRIGIVPAIDQALRRGLRHLSKRCALIPEHVSLKLDGGLRAPKEWRYQETIIKGDVTEPVIGLASIVAKVTRDQYMSRLATRAGYLQYDFSSHKGYGTKAHRAAIARYGLSDVHRQSYCKNIELL